MGESMDLEPPVDRVPVFWWYLPYCGRLYASRYSVIMYNEPSELKWHVKNSEILPPSPPVLSYFLVKFNIIVCLILLNLNLHEEFVPEEALRMHKTSVLFL